MRPDTEVVRVATVLRDFDLLRARDIHSWDHYYDMAIAACGAVRSSDRANGVIRVNRTLVDNYMGEVAMLRSQLNEALNRISR